MALKSVPAVLLSLGLILSNPKLTKFCYVSDLLAKLLICIIKCVTHGVTHGIQVIIHIGHFIISFNEVIISINFLIFPCKFTGAIWI